MTPLGRLLDPTLVEALNRLATGARRTALGVTGGLHKSPFKGASVDFRQHRGYVPGDDVRRLDWRVLARTDRPFVREYDDETTLRTLLAVDASGSMGYGRPASKLDDALRLAAALAYVTLAAGESTGSLVAGASDAWVPPASTETQLARVIESLETATATGETTLDTALVRAPGRIGRRALVIVLSDLIVPPARLRRALARLRHDRHGVVVVRVLHPDETRFPFRGFVRFRSAEGGPPVLTQAAAIRSRYLDNLAAHDRATRAACRACGAEFVDHVVGRPIIETLRAIVGRSRP